MKVKKKYLGSTTGFVRFKNLEINYSFYEWALPVSIDFSTSFFNFRILFVSFYFSKYI